MTEIALLEKKADELSNLLAKVKQQISIVKSKELLLGLKVGDKNWFVEFFDDSGDYNIIYGNIIEIEQTNFNSIDLQGVRFEFDGKDRTISCITFVRDFVTVSRLLTDELESDIKDKATCKDYLFGIGLYLGLLDKSDLTFVIDELTEK